MRKGKSLLKAPKRAERAIDAGSSSFKFIPTSVPPWVPAAVRKWALDGLFFIHEKDKEVSQRLLTDKRMRRVWRELTKRDKTNKPFHQPDRSTNTLSVPFDTILVAFFDWSCTAARTLRPLLTKDEAVKLSNEIRMFPDFSTGGVLLSRSYLEVKRHTTRDRVRAYVLLLARACKALFHSPLYSTIATTASVALNTQVDAAFVRSVLRNPPREQEIESPHGIVQSRKGAPPAKTEDKTAAKTEKTYEISGAKYTMKELEEAGLLERRPEKPKPL
jgi:hypothetical protein